MLANSASSELYAAEKPFGFQDNIATFSILGIEKVTFKDHDVLHLPAGSNTGSLLEHWYISSVVANQEKGGFSTTEDLILNTHGSSLRWQKYWLHDMDISDPLNEGQAFIDIPFKAWSEFNIRPLASHYGDQGGYQWRIMPGSISDKQEGLKTDVSIVSHLGGPTFMVPRTFDREPSQAWGAPEFRRHFSPSYELSLGYPFPGLFSRPAFGFVEFLSHNRNFINIGNGTENNFRVSLLMAQELPQKAIFFLAYQGRLNEYLGVEDRHISENLLSSQRHHLVLAYDSSIDPIRDDWEYHVGFGLGFEGAKKKGDHFHTDLRNEIINPAPIRLPDQSTVFFIDSRVERNDLFYFKEFLSTKIHIRSPIRFELVGQEKEIESFRVIRTLDTIPLDVLIFDKDVKTLDTLFRLRPSLVSESEVKDVEIILDISLLYEQIINSSKTTLFRASPASSLKLNYNIKATDVRLFLGLQHEPIPMGISESQFLNSDSQSARRFRWIDQNQDNQFQDQEQGGILRRSGGAYHNKSRSLKHPSLEEAYLGADYRFLKKFKAVINVSAKWIRDLYWVDHPDDFDPGYERINRENIHSGSLYNRNPGSYGEEVYSLTNRNKDSTYLALELQLLKEAISSWWFFNISLGGYLHLAHNLAGNGAFRNDIGFYSEQSADPNQNLVLEGRTDYDRGYMVNIIFGFYIMEGLSLSNIIRYRDGVPLGEFMIAHGLSQGPIAIMNEKRANGLEGIGRYTFYLNWDIRIRYTFKNFEFFLDIYNLLDSRTETLEDPFKGETFRYPLDSTIPRSFRFTVSYRFI